VLDAPIDIAPGDRIEIHPPTQRGCNPVASTSSDDSGFRARHISSTISVMVIPSMAA